MRKTLMTKSFFTLSIICVVFSSCLEENTNSLDTSLFGYEYFPLEIGKYWLYQVDSTIIDEGGAKTLMSTFYIREEVVDKFQNNLGEDVFVIQKSKSDIPDGTFLVTDAWSAELNEDYAVRTEENLRFVKLVFPIDKDRNWEGNQFDELTRVDVAGELIWVYKDWGDYRVIADGIPVLANGKAYSDAVIIQQADFESDVELRQSTEYYAPNIGLIRKEMSILDTQCLCPGEEWIEKAEAGFILSQHLIESN